MNTTNYTNEELWLMREAAPELLEALELLCYTGAPSTGNYAWQVSAAQLEKAKAAIAKATGQDRA